ncbi:unnamed protein product [Absidia cylindrospora]
MEKHPDFDGKIVILGYSLGGILTWDILSHQRQPSSPEEEQDYRKLDVIYEKLDFKPNYFFTLGSPIGAVLTFRNQSPVTYHPDYDIVFENLFHPFDPLAYRIEPLYDEYYTDQPAVLVERSVPIGPSFSFPSLPSLPGMGLFSYFSWKMSSTSNVGPNESNESNILEPDAAPVTSKNPANHMHNNTSTDGLSFDTKDKQPAPPSNLPPSIVSDSSSILESQRNVTTSPIEEDQGKSIMTSFLQYFSKGRRGSKDASDSKTNSTSASITTSEIGEQEHELPSPNDNMHGIITWDPLQEQRHAVLSSDTTPQAAPPPRKTSTSESNNLNNDKDHNNDSSISDAPLVHSTSSSTTNSTSRRPLQRAKTYCAQGLNDTGGSMLFYEIDKSDYSVTVDGDGFSHSESMDMVSNTNGESSKRNSIDNMDEKPHPKLRHLVEVLGIDGVRMESFERAKANFSRNTSNSDIQHPEEQQKAMDEEDNTHPQQSLDQAKKIIREGATAYSTTPEGDTTPAKPMIIETDKDTHRPSEDKGRQTEKAAAGADDSTTKAQQEEEAQARQALEHLPGNRRMDFALQPDGFMSMIANEYIVGLRAHFSYWTSKDLMWHILQTLEK